MATLFFSPIFEYDKKKTLKIGAAYDNSFGNIEV
jgi:hypothetical protein